MGLLALLLAFSSLLNAYERYTQIAERGKDQTLFVVNSLRPQMTRHLGSAAWIDLRNELRHAVANLDGKNLALLLGGDGRILVSDRPDWIDRPSSQIIPGIKSEYLGNAQSGWILTSPDKVEAYQALPMGSGSEHAVLYVGRDLRPLYQAFWQEQLVNLLPLWAIGAVVMLALMLALNRLVTQPIVSLADHARRLGFGNYGTTVEVDGKGELATLARAQRHEPEHAFQPESGA